MMPPRRRWALLFASLVAVSTATAAHAESEGIDTEHLFGFTEGSDIGAPPERELESETTARIGKRGGQFRAVDSGLTLKLPLSDRFRIAPGISLAGYDIAGVPGLDDRSRMTIGGAFVETRARLLSRDEAPFGLTVNTVIGASRIDAATGLGASGIAAETGLLIDRELVPGELVAGLNLVYAFANGRVDGLDGTQRASSLEVSGAIAQRVAPGTFVGLEARYLRAYAGLSLDRFAGEAVYLGPTFYRELTETTWVSFTWGRQVAGEAIGTRGSLDLTNFDRHQVRLRIGTHF